MTMMVYSSRVYQFGRCISISKLYQHSRLNGAIMLHWGQDLKSSCWKVGKRVERGWRLDDWECQITWSERFSRRNEYIFCCSWEFITQRTALQHWNAFSWRIARVMAPNVHMHKLSHKIVSYMRLYLVTAWRSFCKWSRGGGLKSIFSYNGAHALKKASEV